MEQRRRLTSWPYGLKTWHTPASPNVDICFIHGFLGHREKTWTSETADQPWPREFLAPNFRNARILTFGYNSVQKPSGSGPNQTLSSLANELNSELIKSRVSSQFKGIPIIFIAHGLGGLICKRAIQSSFQSNLSPGKEISRCLLGIIFMGTPHTEPDLADVFLPLVAKPSTSKATLEFLESLDGNDQTPTLLNDAFIRTISSIDSSTNIFCFFETKPQGNYLRKIVNADSATLPEYQSQSIISSHLGMTKFGSVVDPGFSSFCTVLRTFIASDRAQTFASLRLSDEAPRIFFLGRDINGHVPQPLLGQSSTYSHQHRYITFSEYGTVASAQYQPEVLGVEPSMPETFKADTVDDRDTSVRLSIRPPLLIASATSTNTKLPIASATPPNTKVSIGIANLPFDVNPNFVGRDDIVQQLQLLFSRKECLSVALYGLGGVGLTQVANAFAHWAKSSQPVPSVIWLPATSRATFTQAFTDVSDKLLGARTRYGDPFNRCEMHRWDDPLIKIRDYVTNDKVQPYIIILDGAHDPSLVCDNPAGHPLSLYLPRGSHVQILITTRSFSVAKFMAKKLIEVDALTLQQSLVMARRLSVQKESHPVDPDDTAMISLLRELQFLPLAVSQAMAFMDHADMTAAEYVKRVCGSNSVLLEEQPDRNRYKESTHDIATTWFSTFEYLQETCPLAMELLQLLSQLEPGGVLISMLPHRLAGSSSINPLKDFHFVSQSSGTLSAHKLVHMATANWVEKTNKSMRAGRLAVDHISSVYRTRPTGENKASWVHPLPHAKYILDNIESVTCPEEMDLCMMLVNSLLFRKDFEGAARYCEMGQNYSSQNRPENNSDRLSWELKLAFTYTESGQFQKAITLLEHVVEIQKTIMPENNSFRLNSEHSLAFAYSEAGQFQKAITLLEHVVKIRKITLPENDYQRLNTEHNLAFAYKDAGQIQEAIPLFKHIVEIRKKVLPENNEARMNSERYLAEIYHNTGQFQKEIPLVEHIVQVRKKTLPENNEARLRSQHNLGCAYHEDGQFKKAIPIFEHVIALYRSNILPENDDKLLSAQSLYSSCLASAGRETEAKEIARQVVATAEKCVPASKHYNLFQERLRSIENRYPDA